MSHVAKASPWAGRRLLRLRVPGPLALVVGVAGMVLGIGIGLRWLRAGVVSWQSVLGVVALVLGVGCLWVGVKRVGRRSSPWQRLTLRALTALMAVVAVWTLAPAVIATQVPPIERGAAPEDHGFAATDVRFHTADGVELAAWFVPSANGSTVIVRHGSGSTASSALSHARVLVENGFGVLVTDARGHGQSGGEAMDFGWYGESDIEAAVSFLSTRPGVDPGRIAVLGLSMGGEEAIGAAGADERIAAVIAEGASARTEEDKLWLVDAYGWRGRAQVGLEWLQYTVTDLFTDASKPRPLAEAASTADVPILMITAGERPDEARAAAHIQAASPGTVSVWTVPGASHVAGLSVDPDAWEAQVVGFLAGALSNPQVAGAG